MWATYIFSTMFILNWALLSSSTNFVDCIGEDMENDVLLCAQSKGLLLALAASTTGVVLSSVVFLSSIVRKYVGSFYKYDSKCAYDQRNWNRYSKTDLIVTITLRDPVYWPREETQTFIAEHWEQWEAEQPSWFADPRWRANIPSHFLPTTAS